MSTRSRHRPQNSVIAGVFHALGQARFRLFRSPLRKSLTLGVLLRPTQILISAALVPITLHLVGSLRFGVWLALSSFLSWALIGQAGLSETVVAPLAMARTRGDKDAELAIVRKALILLATAGVVIFLLYSVSASLIDLRAFLHVPARISGAELFGTYFLNGLLISVSLPVGLSGALYEADNRSYVPAVANLASRIVAVAGIEVLTLWSPHYPLVWLAGIATGSPVLAALILWRGALPRNLRSITHDKGSSDIGFRWLIRLSTSFTAFQIRNAVVLSTDSLLIAHILRPQAVVPYALAFRLATLLIGFAYAAIAPLRAGFARAFQASDWPWILQRWRQLRIVSVASALAVGCGLTLFGRPLIRLWTGPSFLPSEGLLMAISAFFVVEAWNYAHFTMLSSSNRLGGLGLAAVADSVLNLALSVFLIGKIGPVGAAIGSLTATTVTLALLLPCAVHRFLSTYVRARHPPLEIV